MERGYVFSMLKRKLKRRIAVLLTAAMVLSAFCFPVAADSETDKPYLALGADLKADEKATVLNLLDVKEEDLDNYKVVTVTNEDEHKYLDSYLSANVIGSRALSSVKVVSKESGYGLQVTTKNITYCTKVMYQNALATAGVENAEITVAGPFNISGTAALVGAMEAYSDMTGEALKPENVETATNELVTTSQIAEQIGDQDKAEELIGAVKDVIVSEEVKDPEKMDEVIEDTAQKLEVTLTEEQVRMIRELMEKISSLDLDINSLKEQAQGLYEKLENLNIDLGISQEEVDGILAQIGNWFSGIWEQIKSWFS